MNSMNSLIWTLFWALRRKSLCAGWKRGRWIIRIWYKLTISVAILWKSSGDGRDVENETRPGYPHVSNSTFQHVRSKLSRIWKGLLRRVRKSGCDDEKDFRSRTENQQASEPVELIDPRCICSRTHSRFINMWNMSGSSWKYWG